MSFSTLTDSGWIIPFGESSAYREITFDRALSETELDGLRDLFLSSDIAKHKKFNYLGYRIWSETIYEFRLRAVFFDGFTERNKK